VLEWPRYGSGHTVEVEMVADPDVRPQDYDLIVVWDVAAQQLTVVQRAGKAAPPTTDGSAPQGAPPTQPSGGDGGGGAAQ
jgi:hypothetical protein